LQRIQAGLDGLPTRAPRLQEGWTFFEMEALLHYRQGWTREEQRTGPQESWTYFLVGGLACESSRAGLPAGPT
jgi:hypothetical protein